MALIKCPECGKEISDKSTNCIHCGCPIDNIENLSEAMNDSLDVKNEKSKKDNHISSNNSSTVQKPNTTKSSNMGCGVIIAIIAVLLCLLMALSGNNSSSKYSSDYYNNKKYRDNVNDIAGAYGTDAAAVDRAIQAVEDAMNK